MAPVRSEFEQTVEYRNNLALLQESGFLPFLQKFDGFDMVIVLEFARTFKEGRVRVECLNFKIIEEFIS